MPFDVGKRAVTRRQTSVWRTDASMLWSLIWPALEREWDRLALFLPVAFGIGAGVFFATGPDGWVPAASAAACAAAGLAWWIRHLSAGAFVALALLAALLAGFGMASGRTDRLHAPMIDDVVPPGWISGHLTAIEPRTDGSARWTLQVTSVDRVALESRPERVRLTVPAPNAAVAPGDHVRLRAILFPIRGPNAPGGYNPRFWAYFDGIGANGRALSEAIIDETTSTLPSLRLRVSAAIWQLRLTIAARITAVLDDPHAGFAVALLTGLRGLLDVDVRDALRISGLGHILAISGLHMAIVAGGLFWVVRAILALVPAGRTVFPAKAVAAVFALCASAGYLALSGAAIASQRAFVMIAVMFIAVIAGRPAITLRNIALAAWVVMLMRPEAVLSAGFQMSFAATIALVAGYQAINPMRLRIAGNAVFAAGYGRVARMAGLFVAGLVMTALLAGLATAPFAAFHFNRVAPYGLVANVLAMPVVSFVVMPAGILGLALMPFGLDGLALSVMAAGLDAVTTVATWVAAMPGAAVLVPVWPLATLLCLTGAAAGLTLMARPPPVTLAALGLAAIALIQAAERPVALINATGSLIAVRNETGHLQFLRNRGSAFARADWLRRDGDSRDDADPSLIDGVQCDDLGCVVRMAGGDRVANSQHAASLQDDCRRAAVIVTRYALTERLANRCARARATPALIVTPSDLDRLGAIALYRRPDGFQLKSGLPAGQDRPWLQRNTSTD